MQRIVSGVSKFQHDVFPRQRAFFEHLGRKQQNPLALFITCSDSRIDPNLVTQTEPGDLFILRNAGNIIPPYGAASSEAATIEYAVDVLEIPNIILCGHSHCGAMAALMRPELLEDRPGIRAWFAHAESTRRIALEKYSNLSGDPWELAVIEENVLVQLNNLSTHPFVASRLATGQLNLFGWFYGIDTGAVLQFDQSTSTFHPLDQARPTVPLPMRGPLRLASVEPLELPQ